MLNNLSCTPKGYNCSSEEHSRVAAIGGVCVCVCTEQPGDSGVMTGVYTAVTGERWTLYQAESFDLDCKQQPQTTKFNTSKASKSLCCVVNSNCDDVTGCFLKICVKWFHGLFYLAD